MRGKGASTRRSRNFARRFALLPTMRARTGISARRSPRRARRSRRPPTSAAPSSSIPTNSQAHNDLGILLAGQGLMDEAIVHFRRALTLDPTSPDARRNLEAAQQERR